MNPASTRILRLVFIALFGFALVASVVYVQIRDRGLLDPAGGTALEPRPFGGDFAGLLDQNGAIQPADAFHDKYQLVFFGFTHCPAICPGELQKLAYILAHLPPDKKARIAPIFVTVDPHRDTPDVMKQYLSMFDPAIIGLTGRQSDIDRVVAQWKVYALRVDDPQSPGEYTMDHSAFTYLRDPEGWLVDLFDIDAAPDAILAALEKRVRS
ncbi:MAG: SCO family protein [Rhodospirillales bacterium]|nr:SCO family protein [Alphaproteobacteria bacterium]MCB9986591.1 SCO family protein [Rhodospirillales bacterium]USO06879.1 MAG: SCO family protein [Rhodospirillales bacterium]